MTRPGPLRVLPAGPESHGENVGCAGIFPIEFRRVQAEYPIVFRKNASTGRFEPLAMLGFEDGENLFVGAAGWQANYLPLTIERQPFLIGFKAVTDGGVEKEEPIVYVDMDSSRISDEGEPVFLEHGGYSPYLEHINTVLMTIHDGHAANRHFSDALTEHELLEPFTLEVELNDGSRHRLAGFHTINEDKLNALDGKSLQVLHEKGYLEHIYMVMASIANFKTLIDKKNERRAEST